ncbi:polysaccharide lyase family 7 protein [Vibrio sp. E150_011]
MIFKLHKLTPSLLLTALVSTGSTAAPLLIESASDWGGAHNSYPASNAIDGSTDWSSRWAAEGVVNLVLDLGSVQKVEDLDIAWGKGDTQSYRFEIRTLADESSSTWDKVFSGSSSGTSTYYENYDITDISARWVRIKIFENTAGSTWTNIKEVAIFGNSSSENTNLDPNVAPSENFDLLDWYLSIPIDEGDGYATSVKENALDDRYEDEFFYTGSDGGMVFYTPVKGVTTSSGTKYVRTELREMLRRGDTSKSTSGKENNWAFSSIPTSDQNGWGGIDGQMNATLAINHVTTTSSNEEQVGRIVVGQIHAEKNEPIRLYYHKLPGNSNGAVYFAHETSKASGGDETWYNLLGNMVDSSGNLDSTSNPSSGIALDETFSYSITVEGDKLIVVLSKNGAEIAAKEVNMANSGYDDADNYMYFKAGIYLQDNSSSDDDYAKVTFYKLDNSHD